MKIANIAIGILLLVASRLPANNNYFIPGDAFFYFEIQQSEWEEFSNGNLSIMEYDRPEHLPFMLCGYAGYQNLGIANLPKQFRDQIVQSVALMKERYPSKVVEVDQKGPGFFGSPAGKKLKEINKIRIFVYNKSFDFTKHRIGLKYNESWPETAVQLGHQKKHFQFDFFIDTPKGITESWRMGSDVKPLAVKFPRSDKGYVTTPVQIDPSEIKFLIAPPVPLESLCFPDRDSAAQCFVVTDEGTSSLTVDKSVKSIWKLTN